MNKTLLIRSVIIGFILGPVLFGALAPETINADSEKDGSIFCREKSYVAVVKTVKMIVTAYTSVPDQTDDSPFITASGKHVEDGIIANNMLPFGTKVRIPKLYGSKIFVVEDRMHPRKGNYQADIWMAGQTQAENFGVKLVNIEVLES